MTEITKLKFDIIQGTGIFCGITHREAKDDFPEKFFIKIGKIGAELEVETSKENHQMLKNDMSKSDLAEDETYISYTLKVKPRNEIKSGISKKSNNAYGMSTTSFNNPTLETYKILG